MNFPQLAVRPRLITTTVAILFCVPPLLGQNPSFVSFNAPGGLCGTIGGTFPQGVNLSGIIAGYYEGCSFGLPGGFIREPNGGLKEFSPPNLNDFLVQGINNSGQILAYGAKDSTEEFVGLLRDINDQWTEFAPSAAFATFAFSINNGGVVAGVYQDSALGNHGFIRSADGSFTTVDDPDALLAPFEGTVVAAINDNGAVTGNYTDRGTGIQRGFIRDQFGNFTNFDAAVSPASTYPTTINLNEEVAGYYCLNHCPINGRSRVTGFLRSAAGLVTHISVPGAASTQVTGINDSGVIVGTWGDSSLYAHGFQRDASGEFREIATPGQPLEVIPTSINNNGEITGTYINEGFVTLGFLQKLPDEK